MGDSGWDLGLGLVLGQVMTMTWPGLLAYCVHDNKSRTTSILAQDVALSKMAISFPSLFPPRNWDLHRVQGGLCHDKTHTRYRGYSVVARMQSATLRVPRGVAQLCRGVVSG